MPAIRSPALVSNRRTPAGGQRDAERMANSSEVPFVKFNPGLGQQVDQFGAKRPLPMSLGLIRDVALDSLTRRRADGERSVALLPGK
jgi:hypothetical protein